MIRNPRDTGEVIPYNKTITCPNCGGEGFVGTPENPGKRKLYYR